MKKTIISIILIWFAISFTYLMITGTILNFKEYLESVNEKMPNFIELFKELKDGFNSLVNSFNAWDFSEAQTFWEGIQVFFTSLWGVITSAFKFMLNISILPVKLIVFIFKVIGAIIPFFN